MAGTEPEEVYHKNISFINGTYICLKTRADELFENAETLRALQLYGCALSNYNPDNLLYVPTNVFPLSILKKNLFLQDKNKPSNDSEQLFLSPMIAVITTNGQAKQLWSTINGGISWKPNDEDDDEEKKLEPLDDKVMNGLETTLAENECILLYTTQADLCERVLMGFMPFHLIKQSDQSDQSSNDDENDDNYDDDDDDDDLKKDKSWLPGCSWTKMMNVNSIDKPKENITDVGKLTLDSFTKPIKFMTERLNDVNNFYNHLRDTNPLSFMTVPNSNSSSRKRSVKEDRGQNKAGKYDDTMFIDNSQYIIKEIVELMCYMDTNQYAYRRLRGIDKLVAYSTMVKKASIEGDASNLIPECSDKNLSDSLRDVYLGLLMHQSSCKTFIDRQDSLLNCDIMSMKAVMALVCGLITNRTFIGYQQSLGMKVYTGRDKKERVAFYSESDTNANPYKAMKLSMGNMPFVISFYINYMRSYLDLCKITPTAFLDEKDYGSIFMKVMDNLNSKNVKTVQEFLGADNRGNAVVMLRIYNQTTDSVLGSLGKTEESNMSGVPTKIKSFGPAYDEVIENLIDDVSKAMDNVWKYDKSNSKFDNFTNLVVKTLSGLETFAASRICSLNFTTQEELFDLQSANVNKIDCVASYILHKSVCEYGLLGQLIAVSINRLLEQKVVAICENRPKGRATSVRTAIATNYSGTTATGLWKTKTDNEVNMVSVVPSNNSALSTLPKDFTVQKQITMKSRSPMVSYNEETMGSNQIYGLALSKEDKNTPVNNPNHITFVVSFILNLCKKLYFKQIEGDKTKLFQLQNIMYLKVTNYIKKMINLPKYTILKQALLPFDWKLISEDLKESLKMFVAGCLLHKKGYLSNITTYSWLKQINPYRIQWVQRFVAFKNEKSEDFDLTKTHFSNALRKANVVIEGAHVHWAKFPNPKDSNGNIIRLQFWRPTSEHAYRFLTLGCSQEVNRTFTVNMVGKKGRVYGFENDPQAFGLITTRLTNAQIDEQLKILMDNLEFFKNECRVNDEGEYDHDTVLRSLPRDSDFYMWNQHIVQILVDLLNNADAKSIKTQSWYIEAKNSAEDNNDCNTNLLDRLLDEADNNNDDDSNEKEPEEEEEDDVMEDNVGYGVS